MILTEHVYLLNIGTWIYFEIFSILKLTGIAKCWFTTQNWYGTFTTQNWKFEVAQIWGLGKNTNDEEVVSFNYSKWGVQVAEMGNWPGRKGKFK